MVHIRVTMSGGRGIRPRPSAVRLQPVPESRFSVVGMEFLLSTDACTLPAVERPARLTEFDSVVRPAVRTIERRGCELRIELSGEDGLAERVRDLAARESACCPVVIEVSGTDRDLSVTISVSPSSRNVLDALLDLLGGWTT